MLRLRVIPFDGDPFVRTVAAERVEVGRSSHAGLVLPDPLLSREHAVLRREGDQWLLEDLGSHNGSFVNGERVRESRVLRHGDVLGLGGSTLTVEFGPEVVHGPSPEGSLFLPASQLLSATDLHCAFPTADDAPALRRLAERLHLVNEVHHALSKPISLNELLELILDRAFVHLRPEEGAIFLRQPSGEYCCVTCRSIHPGGASFQCSRHLIHEVADKGLAALTLDARTDERFAGAESILGAGVRSLIAAPLQHDDDIPGMIVLCSKISVRQFTEEDLELLVTLASVAAMRVRNLALAEESAERRRLEAEVTLARSIQVALLPESLPSFKGYAVHGGNVPSRWVSGDFYQVLSKREGSQLVVMVADVAGKGVGASLVTASLEALCAAPLEAGLPPAEVFQKVSTLLNQRVPQGKFATALLGVLDCASGRFRIANAGHPPAILLRAGGGEEWLEATGVPLALFPESGYLEREVLLGAGDLLVCYSDGISEAEDPEGEPYGPQRIADLCRRTQWDNLDALALALELDLDAFVHGASYTDDRTVVFLRRLT